MELIFKLHYSTIDDHCDSDYSCGDDLVCGGDGADCTGNMDSLCNVGLVCVGDSCTIPRGLFSLCDNGDDTDCRNGLECFSGVCLGSHGTPCDENEQCADTCISLNCAPSSSVTESCDDTEDCNGSGLICSENRCLLEDSSLCNENDECINVCINNECNPKSENGGECNEDLDCVQPSTCFGDTCRFADAEACSSNDECNNVCINSFCNTPASIGEACDENTDCNEVDAVCSGGSCLRPNGKACDNNQQCVHVCIDGSCKNEAVVEEECDAGENDDCISSAVCSGTTCLYETGTSCSSNSQCIEACIGGECMSASTLGGSCDSGDDLDCVSPLDCYREQCLNPNGEPCADNSECVRVCIQNTCSDVEGMGEPCDEEADCQGFIDCGEDDLCGGQGASCTPNNDTLCNIESGAEACIFNVCDVLRSISGLCQEDADCEGSIGCSSGTCGSAGASCVFNTDCNSAASLTCIHQVCSPVAGLGGQCDAHDPNDCVENVDCGEGGVCGGSRAGEFIGNIAIPSAHLDSAFNSQIVESTTMIYVRAL